MEKGRYRLVWNRKVIRKAFVWYNGTLGDKRRTVIEVGVFLEDAMPMLQGKDMKFPNTSHKKDDLTTEVTKSNELFVRWSVTSICSSSPYGVSKSKKKGNDC